jgi:16S rRNA (guanine1516-N2)-methyltransferase
VPGTLLAAAVAVVARDPAQAERAGSLAGELQLPLLPVATDPRHCTEAEVVLLVGAGELLLQQTGGAAPGPVGVDFGAAGMRHRRRAAHNELLGRAVGVPQVPPLAVLDATAGLGRDAFVLADLGCQVTLCERVPLLAAMLAAGLAAAAASDDSWLRDTVARMTLLATDCRELARERLAAIDVIYLDPMFPPRDKAARVKKELAILQRILQLPDDADALLAWAVDSDVARVVVKRPLRAAALGGASPSHSISGKAVRYDVYVRRKLR